MDSGIKVAILIACVLSLGLGVVWDKVISGTREVLEPAKDSDSMAPDTVTAKVVGAVEAPIIAKELPGSLSEGDPGTSGQAATSLRLSPEMTPTPASAAQDGTAPSIAEVLAKLPKAVLANIKDGKYVVQPGDSFWKIAHRHFTVLGKDTVEWQAANSGTKLRPGDLLNIPS